jgi:hypothetical protein
MWSFFGKVFFNFSEDFSKDFTLAIVIYDMIDPQLNKLLRKAKIPQLSAQAEAAFPKKVIATIKRNMPLVESQSAKYAKGQVKRKSSLRISLGGKEFESTIHINGM